MSGSIGSLFATVSADASQFVAEFNRADNQARRTASNIRNEVDRMTNDVQRKFSAAKLGGDFLKGIGLGSSFAVINTVLEKITDRFREQAELAERILKLTERTRDAVEARLRLGRTDEQQLAKLEKERAALQEILKLDIARGQAKEIIKRGALEQQASYNASERARPTLGAAPFVKEMQEALRLLGPQLGAEKVAEVRAQIEEISLEIEKLSRSMGKAAAEASKAALETNNREIAQAVAAFDQQLRGKLKAESDAAEWARKHRAELSEEGARMFDAVLTPMERYRKELERINTLEKEGALTSAQAVRIRADAWERASGGATPLAGVRFDIDEDTPETLVADWTVFQKKMYEIFDSVGDRASSAFADMVISGENAFKSLTTVIAKSVMEMLARLAIINPILNTIFGLSGSNILPTLFSSFGGAKASGGPVSAGMLYQVNENGPEYFQPNVNGTIIPNNRLAAAGVGGGDSYAFTYNIQAGVSRAELVPILRLHSEATIGEIRKRDRQRR